MEKLTNKKSDVKKIFKEKGTCSQTYTYLLNREFEHTNKSEELATDPFAGGIMQKGQQCGMLWGAALAVGKASYHRNETTEQAIESAIMATRKLVESFKNRSNTINCRDITRCNLDNFFGLNVFMLKTMIGGMENSTCFNLAENWEPEAIEAAKEGLLLDIKGTQFPLSCASELVRKMGGTDEEIVMVAGFAGGLGLSGMGCGALSAAIWMNSLMWVNEHPNKSAYKNAEAKKTLKEFYKVTNKEIVCQKICGQQFNNVAEHTKFIKNGGCSNLINTLSGI